MIVDPVDVVDPKKVWIMNIVNGHSPCEVDELRVLGKYLLPAEFYGVVRNVASTRSGDVFVRRLLGLSQSRNRWSGLAYVLGSEQQVAKEEILETNSGWFERRSYHRHKKLVGLTIPWGDESVVEYRLSDRAVETLYGRFALGAYHAFLRSNPDLCSLLPARFPTQKDWVGFWRELGWSCPSQLADAYPNVELQLMRQL